MSNNVNNQQHVTSHLSTLHEHMGEHMVSAISIVNTVEGM